MIHLHGSLRVLLPFILFILGSEKPVAASSDHLPNKWIHGIQHHGLRFLEKRQPRTFDRRVHPVTTTKKERIKEEELTDHEVENRVMDDSFQPTIVDISRNSAEHSWPLMVWGALPPSIRDAKSWGSSLVLLARFGLALYLARALWKAATEVVGEFMQEISGIEMSGFTKDQVATATKFLELSPEEAKAELERVQTESGSRGFSQYEYLPALHLAQKLALAGLPLRSHSHSGKPGRYVHADGVSRPSVETILATISRQEASILQQCLWTPPANDIKAGKITKWEDIVGLDSVKTGLLSLVTTVSGRTPSRAYESLFDHSSSCTGVLLYGPPGCGKSFLIKALSTQSKLPCLVVTPSTLLRKYVGEANQLCRALFSLAEKLAPCILCIDEVDGLFRERSDSDHEGSRDLKTEFLQHLDGMMSSSSSHSNGRRKMNLVVAATNRPFDVDSAILRRLTQSHFIPMPDVATRSSILRHFLRFVPTVPNLDIGLLAARTEGYSPSDLRNLLREAASLGPLRESDTNPPPLTTQHVLQAMRSSPPTPLSAQYRWAIANFAQAQSPEGLEHRTVQNSHVPSFLSGPGLHGNGFIQNTDSKWETSHGNFYHLGNIQIESADFDKLIDMAEMVLELEEQEEDYSESDGNNDHDSSDDL